MNTQFSIQKQLFSWEKSLEVPSFTVSSIPRKYEVCFPKFKESTAQFFKDRYTFGSRDVILIDSQVMKLHDLTFPGCENRLICAPATEDYKTLDGLVSILDMLAKHSLTRSDRLIVIGGGIMEDVGGLAAGLYKRGLPWVFFPTTLLAMSDSRIGGKANINFKNAKNQLAMFSAPREVIIQLPFLKTLAEYDVRSGMGEILKLHIIAGDEALNAYQASTHQGLAKDEASLESLIKRSLLIKKAVIEVDEFELGARYALNYGHTVGHAVEILSQYSIPHGQAVVVGMLVANDLAHDLGILKSDARQSMEVLLKEILSKDNHLAILKKIEAAPLLKLLSNDKKSTGSEANFILPVKPGEMIFQRIKIDPSLADKIIASLNRHF